MSTTNSETQSGPSTSRRGPIELPSEKRWGRTDRSDSLPACDCQARPSLTVTGKMGEFRSVAKTRGEIEAGICAGITHLQQEYLGRGPQDIHVHLIVDLLVVRLFGVLTVTERQLVNAPDFKKNRHLVKQVRTQLIETARPVMEALVENETGVKVISLHHDLSTVTAEEFILFTLAEAPACREGMKKRR